MRWYQVFATHPIGRGLDHPLWDPDQHERVLFNRKDPLDPSRRWGDPVVWRKDISSSVRIDHPMVRDLIALNPPHFRICGRERFVREFLPNVDFAYSDWGWSDSGHGPLNGPSRSLLCNARTREALVGAGLFKPAWFEPVATVSEEQARAEGCVILDRTIDLPMPGPLMSPNEVQRERAQRQLLVAPTPRPTLRVTVKSIRECLQTRVASAWKPISPRELTRILASPEHKMLPVSWRTLLPLLPAKVSGIVDGESLEAELVPPRWNDWLPNDDDNRPAPERPSRRDLVIAETPYGDWFSVRIAGAKAPRDTRVTHWDHETLSAGEEWPSVAAFVTRWLQAADSTDPGSRD